MNKAKGSKLRRCWTPAERIRQRRNLSRNKLKRIAIDTKHTSSEKHKAFLQTRTSFWRLNETGAGK